jgi:hypothetical protein
MKMPCKDIRKRVACVKVLLFFSSWIFENEEMKNELETKLLEKKKGFEAKMIEAMVDSSLGSGAWISLIWAS